MYKISALFILLPLFAAGAQVDDGDKLKFFREGKEAFAAKKYQTAEGAFKKFIKTQPYLYEIRDAFYHLGLIKLKQKDYFEAISQFSILQNRFPHSKYRKKVLYYLGRCYYEVYIPARAERYLTEYLRKDLLPDKNIELKITARIYMAHMARRGRAYKRALKFYHASINLVKKHQPRNRERLRSLYYEMGILYSRKRSSYKRAVKYLNDYLRMGGKETLSLKFALRKLKFFHLSTKNGLPENTIADIKVDGDDVYIATWTSGLVRYSRSTGEFERIRLPSRNLRNIYVDDTKLYLTTFDGILVYDKTSGQSSSITQGNRIFNLAQKVIKDDRILYFSTLLKGVVKYDVIRKSIETLGRQSFLKTNEVYALEANHRYVAFGTLSKGAVLVDKKNGKTHYIGTKNKMLRQNNIKALLIDGRYLWIGVHNDGIYRYDIEQKKIKFYDWKVAFPTVIIKREKEIWVGSSGHGIRVYNQASGKLQILRAIEGLSSNDINLLQIEGDYVWIGYLDAGIDVLYHPYKE